MKLPHHELAVRTKDDIHEWSIYRQNLTASLAEAIVPIGKISLPYGDFRMESGTVESVKSAGQQESKLEDEDIYVSFGLPRLLPGKLLTTMRQSAQNMETSTSGKTHAECNRGENSASGYSRHNDQCFSNMDTLADSGYNYLKYAKYSELITEENRSVYIFSGSYSNTMRSRNRD
uniref:SET domain-containing protein n=1 Tax=Heterorhabditis bacteriophora TaxID=37862 RepID=A0A1I7WWC0_HETBA